MVISPLVYDIFTSAWGTIFSWKIHEAGWWGLLFENSLNCIWSNSGYSLNFLDFIVEPEPRKMLEMKMQMTNGVKPAEADHSKKKYGTFLALFEEQLWVDNS